MKRAMLHGARDLRVEEAPDPVPGPGEVVVRVDAALTCGTDLKVWRRGGHAKFPKPPLPFGHEFAGRVESAGEGAGSWKKGDRVMAANSAPCGACGPCGRGRFSLCEDLLFLNGAFAEKVLVPRRIVEMNLHRLDPGLRAEVAALAEPLACALKGVDDAGIRKGEGVAVLGCGPLGILLTGLASQAGARVAALGKGADRLAMARKAGAVEALDLEACGDPRAAVASALGGAPDRVLEAVGSPGAWALALDLVGPGGLALMFGGCPAGSRVAMDAGRVHYEEITIRGSFHHTPAHVRAALTLLGEGRVWIQGLLGEEAGLGDLPALFVRLDRREIPFKAVIRC